MEVSKICTKCNLDLPLSNYPIQRKGKLYESMANYCRGCRKKQMYLNLNSNVDKFLSDKFHRIKNRASKLGCEFDLDREYFISLYHKQQGKCFYTDIDMDCRVGMGKSRNSLSVDKLIPEKGYTKGNIVFCSNKINTIKSDMTLEELKEWIPKWYKRIINYD